MLPCFHYVSRRAENLVCTAETLYWIIQWPRLSPGISGSVYGHSVVWWPPQCQTHGLCVHNQSNTEAAGTPGAATPQMHGTVGFELVFDCHIFRNLIVLYVRERARARVSVHPSITTFSYHHVQLQPIVLECERLDSRLIQGWHQESESFPFPNSMNLFMICWLGPCFNFYCWSKQNCAVVIRYKISECLFQKKKKSTMFEDWPAECPTLYSLQMACLPD